MNDFWMSVILTGVLLFLGFLGLVLWVWAEQRLQPITEKDKEEFLQDIERIKNMKPHQIIIPQAEEWISEEVLQRRKRYETDKDFKFTADHIHESRMLSNPCCDDCMRLAELQMKKKAELWEE